MDNIKKADFKILALMFMCLIFGGMATYIYIGQSEKHEVKKALKDEAYQNLSDLLIKINGYITSGVNSEEWTVMIRDLSILISKYNIVTKPSEAETALLRDISSSMRKASDAWKVSTGQYSCWVKNPSEECIRDYATDLYAVNNPRDTTLAEFINNITLALKSSGKTLQEHKGDVVSWKLTFVGVEIGYFFKFHGVVLE